MGRSSSSTLVAILANPPLNGGRRTLNRVTLAAGLLGYHDVAIANLFALPSRSTGAIGELGATDGGWVAAREPLESRLALADGVLFAYGTTPPPGSARLHFRDQVAWLRGRVAELNLPAWQVGNGPRHPSRWQRWTHRAYPERAFADSLRLTLTPVPFDSVGVDR